MSLKPSSTSWTQQYEQQYKCGFLYGVLYSYGNCYHTSLHQTGYTCLTRPTNHKSPLQEVSYKCCIIVTRSLYMNQWNYPYVLATCVTHTHTVVITVGKGCLTLPYISACTPQGMVQRALHNVPLNGAWNSSWPLAISNQFAPFGRANPIC